MDRETLKVGVAIIAMVAATVALFGGRPEPHRPGILAPQEPLQLPAEDARPWQYLGYEIRPRAAYTLHGRVLAATHYRWDRGARLAPVDLAVGWGVMSDTTWLDRFDVTQGSRYFTLYPRGRDADLAQALLHSANMHLIPGTPEVRRALEAARAGNLVTLHGRLVDVSAPDGFSWHTSLRRDDTGAGACELVWVDRLEFH
jgi:hypothetical protein